MIECKEAETILANETFLFCLNYFLFLSGVCWGFTWEVLQKFPVIFSWSYPIANELQSECRISWVNLVQRENSRVLVQWDRDRNFLRKCCIVGLVISETAALGRCAINRVNQIVDDAWRCVVKCQCGIVVSGDRCCWVSLKVEIQMSHHGLIRIVWLQDVLQRTNQQIFFRLSDAPNIVTDGAELHGLRLRNVKFRGRATLIPKLQIVVLSLSQSWVLRELCRLKQRHCQMRSCNLVIYSDIERHLGLRHWIRLTNWVNWAEQEHGSRNQEQNEKHQWESHRKLLEEWNLLSQWVSHVRSIIAFGDVHITLNLR